ncbi:similar to Saccharomyces cerevisiae YEL025C Putative protein of unknown function [Maudiozyma saulgeensis]|uniref:Cleavage/polyadenylation specificity factor A subunit N-terminal domain-containing protein n=1 Tax=Maudiozyma saulgeensis TaxID=1789683 RepID=A0A1X7R156_9SACH|nr:similar to Saccharomyces cerevisiae YEL025C Putative protein of unknown function [Kazachstania saulgeensis]
MGAMRGRKVVLDKIPNNSNKIINCFVTINNLLLIVETEQIRYGPHNSNNKELNLKNLQCKKLIGYASYATLYLEPLTRKQYLFLIMQNGRIDIRDLQLDIIDSIETSIPLYDATHSIQTLFEPQVRILYVNLLKDCVHMIRLQLKNDVLRFLHSDRSIVLIQTLSSTIMSMDILLEYDIYTNEEFTSIGILSKSELTNEYYFQAIFRKNGTLIRNKLKWETLIQQRKLPTINDENNELKNKNIKVELKAIENVGFFFFTLTAIMFITLPNGFENIIAGQSIATQDIYYVQGPYLIDILNLEENRNLELKGMIDINLETASIEFVMFTNTLQLIRIKIIKIMEDDEKYIKHWGKFNITNQKMLNQPRGLNDYIIELYYFKELHQYFVELKSDQLILAELNKLDPLCITKYEEESFVCSSIIGGHTKRIIRTGFTNGRRYFIDQESTGFEHMYHFENLFDIESAIEKIWTTNNGDIYWLLSSSEKLYFNGKILHTESDVKHITHNNKIISNISIVNAVDIWNAKSDCYCYVTSSGKIKWDMDYDLLSAQLPKIGAPQLPNIKLYSSMKRDLTNITLCATENKILMTSDYGKTFKTINCNETLGTISSIFYHEVDQFCNIFVSDIQGKIWVLDGESFKSVGVLNINSHALTIIGLHNSDNLIVYSNDAFIILYPSIENKLRYEYFALEIPYNIAHVISNATKEQSTSLIIVTYDSLVLKMNLDLNRNENMKSIDRTYSDILINKFVKLPSSNRFLVALYITIGREKDNREIIDKSGVCIYDTYKNEIVTSYDMSKDFPHVVTTDVSSVAYQLNSNASSDGETKISFAKQLIFDQCFVVSLNYEIAETDKGPKLLLFMLNSENGDIELQTTSDTFYNVNCLYNYDKNMFVACGDCIQLFKLDYSVQENIFHVMPYSNKIYVNGYLKQISVIPDIINIDETSDELRHDKKRLKMDIHKRTKFIGTDILRGFYECILDTENIPMMENSTKYTFRPIKMTEIHPIITDIFRDKIITDFHFTEYDGLFFFLVCSGLNKIKIYMTPATEEEYDMIEFYLPYQVTSVCLINKDGCQVDPSKNILIEENKIEELFGITSINGGHYILGVLKGGNTLSLQDETDKKNMTLQLRSIGLTDDNEEDGGISQSEPQFIDNRILSDDTLCHIYSP